MKDPGPDRVKLTVELYPEQMSALRKHIPWGLQRQFFSALIDDVIAALEQHGGLIVAAVIDNQVRPGECISVLRALMEKKP